MTLGVSAYHCELFTYTSSFYMFPACVAHGVEEHVREQDIAVLEGEVRRDVQGRSQIDRHRRHKFFVIRVIESRV